MIKTDKTTVAALVVVLVGVLVASVGGTAAADGTSARWVRTNPVVPTRQQAELATVSCVRTRFCLAVGHAVDLQGREHAVAETWNGTRWQLTPRPAIAGVTLTAVSCATRSSCLAVGSSHSGGVVRRWDGNRWQAASPPVASLIFTGVSCAGPTACVVVGSDRSSGSASARRWDGVGWSGQSLDLPPGATSSFLADVSCAGATACTAVGGYRDAVGSYLLVERWDGVTWQQQPLGGAVDFSQVLQSVSCPSDTSCTAVGLSNPDDGDEGTTVAAAWDGVAWTLPPVDRDADNLTAVSCSTGTDCLAVGQDAYSRAGVAERWDGSTWTRVPRPPLATYRPLADVSCRSGGCLAVGARTGRRDAAGFVLEDGRAVALRWDGDAWSDTAPLNTPAARNSVLRAVSCSAPHDCLAVGQASDEDFDDKRLLVPVVERWTGDGWRRLGLPVPKGTRGHVLGVHCVRGLRCVVVIARTSRTTGTDTRALFLTRTRAGWQKRTFRLPADAFANGVDCTSLQSCVVVGVRFVDGKPESWSRIVIGRRFVARSIPAPRGRRAYISAVACLTSTDCLAVGSALGARRAMSLAAHWDGRRWHRIATPPVPLGTSSVGLETVGCAPSGSCVVSAFDGNRKRSELARWDGSAWHRLAFPSLGTSTVVDDVQCSRASSCVAVGVTERGAFVARERGTRWRVLYRSAQGSQLGAVDCAGSACLAVGSTYRTARVPFAVRSTS